MESFTLPGSVSANWDDDGAFYLLITDKAKSFSVRTNNPAIKGFFRDVQRRMSAAAEAAAQPPEPNDTPRVPTGRDMWVSELYSLTSRFHTTTGQKVSIADLLDLFFVQSIKEVEADDRDSFRRLLVERLQSQSPGWDQ